LPGLCSLTGLEAILARPASTFHRPTYFPFLRLLRIPVDFPSDIFSPSYSLAIANASGA